MLEIIAIANQKGGVGKTTTAINLSSCLGAQNYKVLLIDLDPQGNCSRGIGVDSTVLKRTLFDAMCSDIEVKKIVKKSVAFNVDLLPANLNLALVESTLSKNGIVPSNFILSKTVEPIVNKYDFVIIDCPPSLGFLSSNALTLCSSVLIPVQCEYFAMEAVAQILASINSIRSTSNKNLEILGFLLTMYDSRTRLNTEISAEVAHTFKEKTLATPIPRNITLAECSAIGKPINEYKPRAAGTIAYSSLAREVIDYVTKKHQVVC